MTDLREQPAVLRDYEGDTFTTPPETAVDFANRLLLRQLRLNMDIIKMLGGIIRDETPNRGDISVLIDQFGAMLKDSQSFIEKFPGGDK